MLPHKHQEEGGGRDVVVVVAVVVVVVEAVVEVVVEEEEGEVMPQGPFDGSSPRFLLTPPSPLTLTSSR